MTEYIALEELYFIRKKYPSRYDYPDTSVFYAFRKMSSYARHAFSNVYKYMEDDDFVFDKYSNEWVIQCLNAAIAHTYELCAYIDPENAESYIAWRWKYSSTLPTKMQVPLHFQYMRHNIRRMNRAGEDFYKQQVKYARAKIVTYNRRPYKYLINQDLLGQRYLTYFERLAKFIPKETERTGRAKKYGRYADPYCYANKKPGYAPLFKIMASYLVVVASELQEILDRFMSGEFLDTTWKPQMRVPTDMQGRVYGR
jgi:hypothetical protein